MNTLAERVRDIAEEYLYLDAPLKELKSKLLHEAAREIERLTKIVGDMNQNLGTENPDEQGRE